ncbi:hypothetical protein N9W17_02180 [Jannaschia sp.]|nr:hypothetical protein [Jannaschia sp.]
MSPPRVVHVEHIRHDPLLGRLTGTVIRRTSDGGLARQKVSAPVDRPSLPHAEADARLRRAANGG